MPKAPSSRRCARCPMRPLLCECIHTKAGKKYLASLAALEQGPVQHMLSVQNSGEPMPSVNLLAPGPPNVQPPSHDPATAQQDAAISGGMQGVRQPSPAPSQPVSTQVGNTSPPKKQKRATKANPYHGHVLGAQKGSQNLEIVRKHAAPEPCDTTAEASKSFAATIGPIIERCDDISQKTGCWLLIVAQHITAQSGMVHYMSPRLRVDAPGEMEDIVNDIDDLIVSLRETRRRDALELQRQLRQAEQEKQALHDELQRLKQTQIAMAAQGYPA